MISATTTQRILRRPWSVPAPMIAEVIVWVVLTGMPPSEAT
jgi:hypothetical protein